MNQKKILDLQEIVIDTKKEHVEAIKATVTTEIKSYFDMVEQNDIGMVSPKSLQTIRTTLARKDREKSVDVMVFGIDELG